MNQNSNKEKTNISDHDIVEWILETNTKKEYKPYEKLIPEMIAIISPAKNKVVTNVPGSLYSSSTSV